MPAPEPLPQEYADAFARVQDRCGILGSRVLYFSTIGSTNDVAAALAGDADAAGTVVIADAQTAGRGRRGRSWHSPPGAGLYVSVVLTPGRARVMPDVATSLLTLTAGVALAEAIERSTGLRPDIKWPNDLLVGRRKLGGILAEGVPSDRARSAGSGIAGVVLGYGINVGLMSAPPEIAGRVTSLEFELGRPVERALVAAETLVCLAERYRELMDGRFDAILDAWLSRAPASRGARVSWSTGAGVRSGVTAGVDALGALLVRTESATERIVAGELMWD
jgi:BirA family biotin operon repressor/biotin-[acetyl-CoA-carboxylase] ligase